MIIVHLTISFFFNFFLNLQNSPSNEIRFRIYICAVVWKREILLLLLLLFNSFYLYVCVLFFVVVCSFSLSSIQSDTLPKHIMLEQHGIYVNVTSFASRIVVNTTMF